MKIVICGGGIVGVSTAYYLAKKGLSSTVIDRCGIACAASGRAGGFLAKDWCDSYELGPLSRVSFEMHMELAQTFINCDYRRLDTFSVGVKRGAAGGSRGQQSLPSWVDGSIIESSVLGGTATTAQVHPQKLTNALMTAANEMVGSHVHHGTVEGIERTQSGQVTGVTVDGDVMAADVVVVAMGPWSGQAAQWLRLPVIRGQRAHGIILKPQRPVTAHALFVEYDGNSGIRSPEVYPRPDGDVYMCGMGDQVALPSDPADVKPCEESIQELLLMATDISSNLKEAELLVRQACYLPISPDGLPLIGKVPGVEGAYIGGGHSCWGILNAPATGAALAELIVDGKASIVDLTAFDPARFT